MMMFTKIDNQKGSALLVTLSILVLLSFLGISSVITSDIDMGISGNEKRSKQAFYVAEAGLERAVADYISTNFGDENISPMVDLFSWIENQAGVHVYDSVALGNNCNYSVQITSVNNPGASEPFIECRDVNVRSVGQYGNSAESATLLATVRVGIMPSGVFDYSYFINHFGWFAGFPSGGARANGNVRANGHFDVLSGYFTCNGNPQYNPFTGNMSSTGGVSAGGYVFPLDGSRYQGMAQYAENRHSYAGVDNSVWDPAVVDMPNLNDPTDADGDDNVQELNPYYEQLARGELGGDAGRVGIDDNGDGELQDSEVLFEGAWGDIDSENGNVVLTGSSSKPIIVDGPVVVTGDLVVKGTVKGQGAFYVGRNTYMAGTVRYSDPPSARPTYNYGVETPEEYQNRVNNWVDANRDKDLVSFQTRENVVLGDHTEYYWRKYITNSGGWLRDYRNDGSEDVGDDGIFGDLTSSGNPYGASAKERDGYWTVDLYNPETGERATADLLINSGAVEVPTGWSVVPGSGEDVDGDGQYDDGYSYNDFELNGSWNPTDYLNCPTDPHNNTFSEFADFTVGSVDGAIYTNHAMAGWFGNDAIVNGSLIARNEALIVGGTTLTLNHDERLTGTNGSASNYSIYLSRIKGVVTVAWEQQ
jgi:Tfp pilus assembly protein PilX